jgi:hypothetical protein
MTAVHEDAPKGKKTEVRKIRCANCGSEWELYPNFEEDQELDELCLILWGIRCPLCYEAL